MNWGRRNYSTWPAIGSIIVLALTSACTDSDQTTTKDATDAPDSQIQALVGTVENGAAEAMFIDEEGAAAAAQPLYAWVQLGDGNSASARAIVPSSNNDCPKIVIDGAPTDMHQRVISPANFSDVKVCEYNQLSSANPPATLKIGNINLPPPTAKSDQVLVVGDTGCRGGRCESSWGWPEVSEQAAANSTPDAILHVGDYLYRETCRRSDCGYKWDAWKADFFDDAKASGLLTKAPWIFVRGNHEMCTAARDRGWHGFFLFFAEEDFSAPPGSNPPPPFPACDDHVAPYKTALNGLDIYIIDTSGESSVDNGPDFKTVDKALATSTTNSWLATHVPIWHNRPYSYLEQPFKNSGLAQRAALRWIQVGHVHLFEHFDAVDGVDGHQAQTVTGGSGVKLDGCDSSDNYADCYASHHTYMVVESKAKSWEGTVYDSYGNPVIKNLVVNKK